ncbi:MAG TPA: hypothetical protein VNO34_08290 [Actinomycetota bacterium]|nr:hypothetical protein [Actinomycetota bacterium]
MRRVVAVLVALLALVALSAPPALAHVHALAPLSTLLACGKASPNAGGNRADDQDNPIQGFIPVSVGSAERSPNFTQSPPFAAAHPGQGQENAAHAC